jgi:prepilin-type N-terminal cleavage/methylation domain-containing protein
MRSKRRRGRRAFTLVELLVVIAILAVLIGLLLPAVQSVREWAKRLHCQNNLHQLAVAFHHANDTHNCMPPGIGTYPQGGDTASGTGLFHILPFVEQGNLYETAQLNGYHYAGYNNVRAQRIELFECPSDPGVGDTPFRTPDTRTWGVSSYAGNAQVFCQVVLEPPYPPLGYFLDPQGTPSVAKITSGDGTSNTILFAEKYARCSNYAWPVGGSLWAYDVSGTGVLPLHSGFEISWNPLLSIGPQSIFQVRPPITDCDPTRASTAHGLMPVALADGSTRLLSPGMSGATWWAACTPAAGDLLGNDWN